MNTKEQIKAYIATQPEPERADMESLHKRILQIMPAGNLISPAPCIFDL